ncbi:AAA family ATPase [Sphingomonas sp. MAH-20]|uniref:AAA family ATPase n=1 Tax=Sphingomonas horti TaxID=2682842 RepID=A0A6I4J0B4_9SPHN|nr:MULTISPECIES: AAA family ATPase [Sphingomonas]MBA2920632.1 AAA family ATPase [Sphingomonas sp. CGMCC 1.13658]MVO77568.1 AAA family ATPase [Sphingomonas horti]
MHIKHIEISNFRKLRAVRIDLAEEKTVFVGANNSGKTSAMVALRKFLVDTGDFSLNDFTLPHWRKLDDRAVAWEEAYLDGQPLPEIAWDDLMPSLDVWLHVEATELRYVKKFLPTIEWAGGLLGVRLRYEPKEPETLRRDYLACRKEAIDTLLKAKLADSPPIGSGAEAPLTVAQGAAQAAPAGDELGVLAAPAPSGGGKRPAVEVPLWPQTITEYLQRRMRGAFGIKAYLLDPDLLTVPTNGEAHPQALDPLNLALESDPLRQLIRVDEIGAQRGLGFTKARTEDEDRPEPSGRRLSSQLRTYYSNHLDPFDKPEPKDFEALRSLEEARLAFEERLEDCFTAALAELQALNYPGVTDPRLKLSSVIRPIEGLNHASAVQYEVPTTGADAKSAHRLPEESNGLGYQNLVSMVFGLMSFRDRWMRVGKAGAAVRDEDSFIAPLHLVLVEEPEAHLHAQVQQVFIKEAYNVLRRHDRLGEARTHRTQLVVSTHSSHIAHACEFECLRYFRRRPADAATGAVPLASVINLSSVFGAGDATARFVTRYLKATHCDLFFADGAILLEGPAERILAPHFVQTRAAYDHLRRCYVSWLEVGGSHAHRLRPLLHALALPTLIVTDLDAKDPKSQAAAPPQRGVGLLARNETLKTWVPKEEKLDVLLDAKFEDKVHTDDTGYAVRVAYQQPCQVSLKSGTLAEALANTFEDALVYENLGIFERLEGTGLIAKFRDAIAAAADLPALAADVQKFLVKGKAEFALNLLYATYKKTVDGTQTEADVIDDLVVPAYIHEGLMWLSGELKQRELELPAAAAA